ncbi:MAG: carboxypeptidase regulatory-like domain-containing protein [Luteitalea sp.]|nr:carboxypeptidase regulatory-like domain-containing protein [Luteitalea sp.]
MAARCSWSRRSWCVPLLLSVSLLGASEGTALAQRFTADLSGTVVDDSGAVLPGATVTLTNEGSRVPRTTVTNEAGFFTFSAAPAATYTLTIELSGFTTAEITGIALQAGDRRSVRTVTLGVSGLSETITVSAETSLTPLTTGEKSATLTARQIEELPIIGTSSAEVLRILPGMTPVTNATTNRPGFTGEVYGINGNGEYQGGGSNNQSAIGNFSGNGTRTQALDITIDGAPGADPGCNCATSVNPNSEFVQEFKVLQSNFGAEHAKGPVAMSVVSKQGGQSFHGAAFANIRDYHLNSNEWFANSIDAEKIKNQFFYPGFTVGGPLVVPKLNENRDKLFFFFGYQYFKQRLDTGFIKSWVPTDAMRQGDFSQAANLGLSGSFVNSVPSGVDGGVIPSSEIDPGGRVLLDLFPQANADANATGGFNYVDNLLVDQNGYQALGRVDANISDSTKLFVRYNMQRETQPFVIGLWWRNGERQVPYPSPIEANNRSDSMTASLTKVFGPSLTNETIFAVTYIDFPNEFTNPESISRQALGYPYSGVFGESDQIPSIDAGSGGPMVFNPGGFDPVLFATKWQVAALNNVTKVFGTHAVKVGFFFEHVTNNQPGNGNSNGNIVLNNTLSHSTGNTFADLLLGRIGSYNEQTQNVLHNIGYNRVEGYAQDSWRLFPNLTVDYGARISFIGPWYDREGQGLLVWDQNRYDPNAPAGAFPGLVWNAIDGSIPTSGVDSSLFVQPRVGVAWDVRGTGATVVRGGFGVFKWHDAQQPFPEAIDLANGVRAFSFNDEPRTLRSLEGLGGGSIVFGGSALDINDDKQPTTYSWSTTVNQKLPWSMNLELSYVGNESRDLMNFDLANLNAVPLGAMLNDPEGNADDYRPRPQYGDLNVYRHSMYQNYHGLQALLTRQTGRFGVTGGYTFSKSLGIRSGDPGGSRTGSEYILDSRQFNYGVLGTDRRHVASIAYNWQLGELQGNRMLNALLGDWQVAGISQFISGAPILGNFDIQGTLADGTPINATQITGSPQVRAQPVVLCDPRDDVPDGFLFNPSCFGPPSPGNNGAYIFPDIRTQAYLNHDLSLMKNIPIGRGDHRLQVRVAAYNVFNHPIRAADQATNLTLNYDQGEQVNADFGRLPEDNKFGRRIVQIALRYTF